MKKLILIAICLAEMVFCFAQEPDTLSLKDRIYYHYDRSEFVEVVHCCKEALVVYQADNDLFEMAGCYNILGIAYQRLGRFAEAIESYELCTEAMEQLKNSEYATHQEGVAAFYEMNIRYTTNNIAEIYLAMDDLDQAETMYRKCLEMLGEPVDTVGLLDKALYLQNLAEVSLRKAELTDGQRSEELVSQSVRMAEQALSLSRQYGDLPFKQVNKMLMLSQAYFAEGRHEEAFALVEEALALAENSGDKFLQAEIHTVYGQYELQQMQYQKAERHFRMASSMAEENHFDELRRTAFNGGYEAARHFDKGLALDYLEKSTAIADSIFNEEQQRLIRDYQVRYDLNEKELQMAIQEEKSQRDKLTIVFLVVLSVLLLVLLVIGFRLGVIRKRQNKALAKLNKAKDHLFSVVSHDFKTSVVSQSMMLDAMNQFYDDMTAEQVKEKLVVLKTSADSLKEKMFNLFEWMKVELGSNENSKVVFNLAKTVKECIAANATEIEQKGLRVVTDLSDLEACDNPTMTRLVLQNLLSNAIKFSWPGKEIRIGTRKEAGRIWVMVEDQGMGISSERKEQLLKSVVSPTNGTKGEWGTGIGLMLCYQLLEQNGGDIAIESQEGQGTKVCFSVNAVKS